MDDTLPDDLWKDSFDKLLEPRQQLRGENILKKNVRASFNMDSSVENTSSVLHPSELRVQVPITKRLNRCATKSISTPKTKSPKLNPFKCSISPIGAWKLIYFDKSVNKEIQNFSNCFEATKIKPTIQVDDYDAENEESSDNLVLPSTELLKQLPSKRQVCFQTFSEEPPQLVSTKECFGTNLIKNHVKQLALHPGKWRKSLCAWKRKYHYTNDLLRMSKNKQLNEIADNSVEFVGVLPFRQRKSIYIKPERVSEKHSSICKIIDYRKQILDHCNQEEPLAFNKVYAIEKMKKCKKLGEGVFGEVFCNISAKSARPLQTVLKIIPIEGSQLVNGEVQKTFEEMVPEIVITKELSNLRFSNKKDTSTSGFVCVDRIVCVQGKYPNHLIKLWEEYDDKNGSENDHPELFGEMQLYLVLELAFGGQDLSSFTFNNAEQTFFALQQIVLTMAVAEEAFQFEHRDLHWGNVLLINTTAKYLSCKIQHKRLTVPTKGVKVTIIDYTLSRMTYNDCCLFNDLSKDEELFQATGDYQFEIYRMMRDILNNKWDTYEPKTNVFWISYIIGKMIDGVSYKNTNTKIHATYMCKLKQLQNTIKEFESSLDFANHFFK